MPISKGHSLILCLMILTLSAGALAGDAEWVEVLSPHFSVVTDAGEKRGREVAERFEQMRVVYGSLMAKGKVNLPIPLQIVAFRNHKEMKQVAPLFHGKPTDMAGLFQPGEDRCFIMLDMSVENPWQVVFHEYAHQLMQGTISRPLDPWFEEGFAEYFSSIEADSKEARVGKIPEYDYEILRHTGLMKTADLFRVQQNSSIYNENGDHRTAFYAESAMVVHYFYDNNMLLKVGEYFGLTTDQKMPIDQAMQRALGMTPATFDKVLRDYVNSGRFKYWKIPNPPGVTSGPYTSRPISQTDAHAVLADIHLHSPDYREQAAGEFVEVLKADPNNAAALRGLGYACLMKQDYEKAGQYFDKAAEKQPGDARVQYYSALLMQREGGFSAQSDPERANKMMQRLEASIKADPEFADAYNLLAFAYRGQRKDDLAAQTMLKALELNPRNDQYRFNLAGIYMDMQKFDQATAILGMLTNSQDQRVAIESQHVLAQLQSYRQVQQHGDGPETPQQTSEAEVSTPASSGPVPTLRRRSEPVIFLQGRLTAVECDKSSAAVLKITSRGKNWRMHAADRSHLVVIGADTFSCDWKDQKVAVNYRQTGEGEGDLISLELQ